MRSLILTALLALIPPRVLAMDLGGGSQCQPDYIATCAGIDSASSQVITGSWTFTQALQEPTIYALGVSTASIAASSGSLGPVVAALGVSTQALQLNKVARAGDIMSGNLEVDAVIVSSITGQSYMSVGLIGPYSRPEISWWGPLTLLKLGKASWDGDLFNSTSEGIVVQNGAGGTYARIKPDRFGLVENQDATQYYFRADGSKTFVRGPGQAALLWTDRTSGNVGIRNEAPAYPLDVAGDAYISGNLKVGQDTLAPRNTTPTTFYLEPMTASSATIIVQRGDNGLILIGTTTQLGGANSGIQYSNTFPNRAQIRLNAYGNHAGVAGMTCAKSRGGEIGTNISVNKGDSQCRITVQGSAGTPGTQPINADLSFVADNPYDQYVPTDLELRLRNQTGGLVSRLYVNSTGYVGINTPLPVEPLHVIGNALISSGIFVTDGITSTGAYRSGSSVYASAFYGDGSGLTGLPSSYFNTTQGSFTIISDLGIQGNTNSSGTYRTGSDIYASTLYANGVAVTPFDPTALNNLTYSLGLSTDANASAIAGKVAKAGDTMTGNLVIAAASPSLEVKTDPALGPGSAPTIYLSDYRYVTPGQGTLQMAHVPTGTPYDAIAMASGGESATLKVYGAGNSVFTARALNSTGPITTGGNIYADKYFGNGIEINGPSTATYLYGNGLNLTHINPGNIDAGRLYGPFSFDGNNLAQINVDGSFTGTGVKCANNTASVLNGLYCSGTSGTEQVALNIAGGYQLISAQHVGSNINATLGQGMKVTFGDHTLGYNVPLIFNENTRFNYTTTHVATTTFLADVGVTGAVSISGNEYLSGYLGRNQTAPMAVLHISSTPNGTSGIEVDGTGSPQTIAVRSSNGVAQLIVDATAGQGSGLNFSNSNAVQWMFTNGFSGNANLHAYPYTGGGMMIGAATRAPATTLEVEGSLSAGYPGTKSTFTTSGNLLVYQDISAGGVGVFGGTLTAQGQDTNGYSLRATSGVYMDNGCLRYGDGTQQCTASTGGGGGVVADTFTYIFSNYSASNAPYTTLNSTISLTCDGNHYLDFIFSGGAENANSNYAFLQAMMDGNFVDQFNLSHGMSSIYHYSVTNISIPIPFFYKSQTKCPAGAHDFYLAWEGPGSATLLCQQLGTCYFEVREHTP